MWCLPHRESTAGKTPDAPERKKQQKEAGPDYQKQAATPPRPAKSNLSDISGSQPAQKPKQFGAFPEAAPSGFVGGGIFPSSAFSNLEALRVSFQTDADKKERAGKWNDKDRQTPGIRSKEENTERKPVPAPKPAKIRQQRQTIEKTLSAEKQAAKSAGCEKDAKNQKGRQSDAENSRQVISADNKNQAENIRIETTLSTENDNPVAEVSGVEAATDQLKPDEPNSTHFHGKPDAAASKPDKKSSGSEEPTKNDPKKNTIEAPGDSRQEQTNAGEDKGRPGQEETYKNSSDDMIKQEDSRSTKDHKEPMKQKDKRGQKEPKSKKETRDVKKRAMEAARKLSDKIPADIIEKVPVFSQIAKQQRHTIFVSEEKWFLKQHIPHKQVIINDLIYDTDNSEMFLRVEGQSGLDNPCVHYNYRTQNGNFFRCTVKYKHEDSIRALDIMEAKHMLEEHPALYRKFFPDSVSDA